MLPFGQGSCTARGVDIRCGEVQCFPVVVTAGAWTEAYTMVAVHALQTCLIIHHERNLREPVCNVLERVRESGYEA
jgi:hypothetical protein